MRCFILFILDFKIRQPESSTTLTHPPRYLPRHYLLWLLLICQHLPLMLAFAPSSSTSAYHVFSDFSSFSWLPLLFLSANLPSLALSTSYYEKMTIYLVSLYFQLLQMLSQIPQLPQLVVLLESPSSLLQRCQIQYLMQVQYWRWQSLQYDGQ